MLAMCLLLFVSGALKVENSAVTQKVSRACESHTGVWWVLYKKKDSLLYYSHSFPFHPLIHYFLSYCLYEKTNIRCWRGLTVTIQVGGERMGERLGEKRILLLCIYVYKWKREC